MGGHAANGDIAAVALPLRDGDAGDFEQGVGHLAVWQTFQILPRDHADRCGRVLDFLFAAGGSDDDIAAGAFGSGILGRGRHGRGKAYAHQGRTGEKDISGEHETPEANAIAIELQKPNVRRQYSEQDSNMDIAYSAATQASTSLSRSHCDAGSRWLRSCHKSQYSIVPNSCGARR